MEPPVAIVGAGHVGFADATPGRSYKELMFEAARTAYEDAGVDPRRDVDSFVCVSEDLDEGTSIFDEYVPDQLGAVQRPVHTVAADGLFGLAAGAMLIASGVASVVAVEGHSKASDVLTPERIDRFALDPIWNRPLEVPPLALAALDMRRFLHATGTTERQCAAVAAGNRRNARANPRAAFAEDLTVEDVLASRLLFDPLRELDRARSADGCVVLVLASAEHAPDLGGRPVWLSGLGWASGPSSLESRRWGEAEESRLAAGLAYRRAGIGDPRGDVDLAEVDDTFAYRELQHLEALALAGRGEAGPMVEDGWFDRDAQLPVNPSGGSLGEGHLREAHGLARALSCVEQLRGEAGERQVPDASIALAHAWRGLPSASAAVAVLSREPRNGG